MLFGLLSFALAADVEIWSYTKFPANTELDGYDGWVSGYDQDAWYGYQGQDGTFYALPATDDREEAGCDQRWAASCNNMLFHPAEDVNDGRFTTKMYTDDDDTIGVVFGVKGQKDYLAFLLCGASEQSTCALEQVGAGNIALISVNNGTATVLATDSGGFNLQTTLEFTVSMNDGNIVARMGNLRLEAPAPDKRKMNGVGFYAYNAGAADRSYVYFWDPVLSALDTDDDGVIDDEDNCQDDANPEQSDKDGDGIGAACDDDDKLPTTDDSAAPTDDSGDGGNGGNGGKDGTGDGSVELSTTGGCTCDGSGGAAPMVFGLLAGLLGLRRRR
ncbi:MAG TPA: hypothetical protein PLA94_08230 [Myxococcota bacterium]|nr:hypothetical protein [Myxococcota bacterium]